MTYVIAKRSNEGSDFHLWREGPRILEFTDQDEALAYLSELAMRFGMDSLILLRRMDVRLHVEV